MGIRLNSEYSLGKGAFMAKKRVGVSGWKVTKKNIRGEEFLPKLT